MYESGAPGDVHLGARSGETDLVPDVPYVLPRGSPYFEPVPNPGCDFE
ncbi:hypothetical protein ACIBJF_06330 [Streptomyces sp. NPDC050743]